MVIGIPTVQRSKENYLVPTIKSLLQNLALYDKNDLLFVVMVADTDMQKVETVFQEVGVGCTLFSEHVVHATRPCH